MTREFKYQVGDLLVLPGLNPLYSLIVDTRIQENLDVVVPPHYTSDQSERGRQYLLLQVHRTHPVWRLAFIIEKHYQVAARWTID